MKAIATANYDFEGLIKGGYVYVDKTDMLYRLAKRDKDAIYFISRPRRFGKSLMLSTFKCLFEGKKKLFKGLKIEKKWDWSKTYPVVSLNMRKTSAPTIAALDKNLWNVSKKIAAENGLKIKWRDCGDCGAAFSETLEALAKKRGPFVLLIDEASFTALVDVAKRQIADGDIRGLLYQSLFGLYAAIPPTWQVKDEAEAKRYFLMFMKMLGASAQPEVPSLLGYADAIVETRKGVYVFEFKFNRSAKAAIRQIREKGYADAYKADKRPVTLIGINFSAKKRNIDEPIIEPL